MKSLLQISFIFLSFSIIAVPQNRIHREASLERDITERFEKIQKSNAVGLQGFQDWESILPTSKRSNSNTVLRNQQLEFNKKAELNGKDSRVNINKTLLGNGFLRIEEIYQTWNGSAWVNDNKSLYTYDVNNYQTEILHQTWDGSSWLNSTRSSYTYDVNNNPAEILNQGWNGSAWLNTIKYSLTYDVNNNKTEFLFQTWNGSAWVNSTMYSYTYDANNNPAAILNQTWNGSVWVNSSRSLYTFTPITQINEDFSWINSYSLFNNYPNPFNPNTIISYSLPLASNVSLIVYNSLGQKIKIIENGFKNAGTYSVNFNATELPSGIYYYRIEAGKFSQIKKMMLLK